MKTNKETNHAISGGCSLYIAPSLSKECKKNTRKKNNKKNKKMKKKTNKKNMDKKEN